MSVPRVSMRNIKECLHLKLEADLSHEKIARALQLLREVRRAHMFVATLGASNYTYTCATPGETQVD